MYTLMLTCFDRRLSCFVVIGGGHPVDARNAESSADWWGRGLVGRAPRMWGRGARCKAPVPPLPLSPPLLRACLCVLPAAQRFPSTARPVFRFPLSLPAPPPLPLAHHVGRV